MASLALTTSGLPPPTGVSTNIQTEFLRPAGKEGGEFVIEAEVVKLGTYVTKRRGLDSDTVLNP
jgi:acyl-coenzyme A thioesterase 13